MAENRMTPFGAFNFLVEFSGEKISAGFSDVSGLNTELVMAEYRNGDDKVKHVRKVPGLHKTGDVTLKRGIIDSEDLWNWITEARSNGFTAKRTVTVTLRDESGTQDAQSWRLLETLPLRWTGPTLAAKGGTEVAMEELVLSCEEIELVK